MRYGAIPENTGRTTLRRLQTFARAHVNTFVPLIQAQAIMAAVRYGVFETLGRGPCRADELAEMLRVDADTLELLLRLLPTSDYLSTDTDHRYGLTERRRIELLEESPYRLTPLVTLLGMWWGRLTHMDRLLETGTGLDLHQELRDPREWGVYQAAMLALARHVLLLLTACSSSGKNLQRSTSAISGQWNPNYFVSDEAALLFVKNWCESIQKSTPARHPRSKVSRQSTARPTLPRS